LTISTATFAAEKVAVEIVNDPRCVEMMARFIKERPELWWEDIGVPPGK
jgi:cytosine deaminase